MITVFQLGNNFHLVRIITQQGLGLSVEGYCDEKGAKEIQQLPKEFLGKLCESCQKEYERVRGQA